MNLTCSAFCALILISMSFADASELGSEGYVDSNGVKIHYVTVGEGPLLVMIHGFADYWFTWREQMPVLSRNFKVVAIDRRGYNKSDQPEGVNNYTMDKSVGDLDAVLGHFKSEKAVIVGHDWGGIIAWTFAMTHPDKTGRLVILNLPHPKGLFRELAHNPEQQRSSQYARDFQQPDAASKLTPEMLASWVKDSELRAKYIEALKRSSIEGTFNYFKANYPREPYMPEFQVKNAHNTQFSDANSFGLTALRIVSWRLVSATTREILNTCFESRR